MPQAAAAASPSAASPRYDRLTVFVFLWACQALLHQEFFRNWIRDDLWAGWCVTALAFGLFLRPRSMFLFAALLATSVVYNFGRWPVVANHILVESVLNLTMLAALGWTFFTRRRDGRAVESGSWDELGFRGREERELFYQRFSPVLMGALVVMYYFAVLAKLNPGFLDPELSCTTTMAVDFIERFPILPSVESARWLYGALIWQVVAIEVLIPVCFTFKRTRWISIAVGLPFHLILGFLGHRTFSTIAYVLYFLFASDEFTESVNRVRAWLGEKLGEATVRAWIPRVAGAAVAVSIAILTFDAAGWNDTTAGWVLRKIPKPVWFAFSLIVMALHFAAIFRNVRLREFAPKPPMLPAARPVALWLVVALVAVNGLTQYVGLKTKSSFTMYSNLTTEGDRWNHFFMPRAMKVADFQDDLVEIVSTNHPLLQGYIDRSEYITYFELRRITSRAEEDFELEYIRRGERQRVALAEGVCDDPNLTEPNPWLAEKLLIFRAVPMGEDQVCFH